MSTLPRRRKPVSIFGNLDASIKADQLRLRAYAAARRMSDALPLVARLHASASEISAPTAKYVRD